MPYIMHCRDCIVNVWSDHSYPVFCADTGPVLLGPQVRRVRPGGTTALPRHRRALLGSGRLRVQCQRTSVSAIPAMEQGTPQATPAESANLAHLRRVTLLTDGKVSLGLPLTLATMRVKWGVSAALPLCNLAASCNDLASRTLTDHGV